MAEYDDSTPAPTADGSADALPAERGKPDVTAEGATTGRAREDLTVEELRAWMRAWIANATNQPVSNISDDRPLDEFGLASRDAVSMAADIEDFTGVALTATVAFQHPTIALLSQRIIDGDPEEDDDALAAEAASYDRGPEFEAARGTHDVAVVGLATRFPHAGQTPESTWEFLIGGGDGTTELPADRWTEFKADPRLKAVLDNANTQGGYLDDVKGFDAEFFSMSPREVEMVDPQQRLAMELTWEALEDAHIPASSVKGGRVGVWLGSSANDYQMLAIADPTKANPYAITGTSTSIVANRVSYFFDFHGPSVTVDTACSSSLVAIHQAMRSLREGETELAIAGGVNMLIVPAGTLGFDSLEVQAKNGKIKAFSSDADGMIRAEGGGVVVLKRLADAERDGDTILGVLAGSAVTSDGRSNGLPAPNPEAQVTNLRDAYRDAGINPRGVDYVEAHGTGTVLGDPIEADALGRVVARGRSDDQPLLIGSVKTNFGHMEAAAGVGGLAKMLLAMQHGEIPASLHYAGPNPYIQFDQNHLKVAAENTVWPEYTGRKLAGITANGFGGTNAHVVLREYTGPVEADGAEVDADGAEPAAGAGVPAYFAAAAEGAIVPLVISGFVPSRRRVAAQELVDWLQTDEARAQSLADIGRALAGRNHGRVRAVVMARTHDDAIKGFTAVAEGKNSPLVYSAGAPDATGPAFIFSGFGSHHRKMAKQLYQSNPVFKYYFDQVNELIIDEAGDDYAEMLLDDSVTYHIETGQVGIFAIQVALAGLFRHHGLEPGVVLPHSMGEATAAWLTGGLSLEDAVRVICNRSRLMGEGEAMLPEEMEKFMALVEYSADDIHTVLADYEGLEICVYAAPKHTVIGGPGKVIDQIVAETEAKGLMARKLITRGASHTSQMDPLLGELQAELMGLEAHPLKYPMYSTVNKDDFYRAGHEPVHGVEYWIKGLRHSVWFNQAVEKAVEAGYRTFIEFSPNPVTLISVMAVTFENGITDACLIHTLKRKEDENDSVMAALAQAYARGHSVDIASLFGPGAYAPIPRTRFQRKPLWIATKISSGGSGIIPGSHVALPDGRHVWQLDGDVLGDQVGLHDLISAAAAEVLSGVAVTAVVEHGDPSGGDLGAAPGDRSLTTTLNPHPGGASLQVHERSGNTFRLMIDAVVTADAQNAPATVVTRAPAIAAPVEATAAEPAIVVSEETEAPATEFGGRWDSESGETVEHRLGVIVSESMGYEIEDLPKEIPLIDLGMDSLLAMRIKNRAEYEFDIPPIQIQAVRDASFNDVVQFVEYAVTHRDQVDALAEHQAGSEGEVADAAQLAELMKAAKEEAAKKAAGPETPTPAPESTTTNSADSAAAPDTADSAAAPDLGDSVAVADAAATGVPPRDAAERLTFATYAIVVGTSPGGVFNELPVLPQAVAEKLTARLSERAGGGEIDIEDVIDSKNIEEMSGYVREQMDDATPVDGFVRTLRKPEASAPTDVIRKPLFLFHPAGGNTMAYEALIKKLPDDLPIYGLERVEGSVEERCRQYLPKIKEIQPEGPYFLAGWSLGGALAYGTARMLEEGGDEVAYIGLLDAVRPSVPITDSPEEKRERLERYERFARTNYDIGADIELPMDRLVDADDDGQFRIVMELVQLSDKKIPGAMVEHQRTSFIDNRALTRLDPAAYGRFGGTVTLYRADRMHDGAIELEPNYAHVDPDGGWKDVVADLDIVHIGGDHLQLIDEPYIGRIAEHMSRALDSARASKG